MVSPFPDWFSAGLGHQVQLSTTDGPGPCGARHVPFRLHRLAAARERDKGRTRLTLPFLSLNVYLACIRVSHWCLFSSCRRKLRHPNRRAGCSRSPLWEEKQICPGSSFHSYLEKRKGKEQETQLKTTVRRRGTKTQPRPSRCAMAPSRPPWPGPDGW